MVKEGLLKKRIEEMIFHEYSGYQDSIDLGERLYPREVRKLLDDAITEYPKVSQKYVPMKGKLVNWKKLCILMEQKIIEFENFGKKWFGERENE
jgi:hypothetical protein